MSEDDSGVASPKVTEALQLAEVVITQVLGGTITSRGDKGISWTKEPGLDFIGMFFDAGGDMLLLTVNISHNNIDVLPLTPENLQWAYARNDALALGSYGTAGSEDGRYLRLQTSWFCDSLHIGEFQRTCGFLESVFVSDTVDVLKAQGANA